MTHHTRTGKRYEIVIPTAADGEVFDWTKVKLVEDERGELEIFNDPDPDHEYCVGEDVAEGLEYFLLSLEEASE